jgi:cytoskeletal protein RodZ
MDRKVDDVRARQGWRGRPVLAILVISMALATLAFLVYVFWAWETSPELDQPIETPAVNSPANEDNPLPTQRSD